MDWGCKKERKRNRWTMQYVLNKKIIRMELVFVKELIILILLGIGASTAWLTFSLLIGAAVIKVVIYLINKIGGEK